MKLKTKFKILNQEESYDIDADVEKLIDKFK